VTPWKVSLSRSSTVDAREHHNSHSKGYHLVLKYQIELGWGNVSIIQRIRNFSNTFKSKGWLNPCWVIIKLHYFSMYWSSHYMIRLFPTLILNLQDYNYYWNHKHKHRTKCKTSIKVYILMSRWLWHYASTYEIPTWFACGFNLWRMCLFKILFRTWETWNVVR